MIHHAYILLFRSVANRMTPLINYFVLHIFLKLLFLVKFQGDRIMQGIDVWLLKDAAFVFTFTIKMIQINLFLGKHLISVSVCYVQRYGILV